MKHSRPIHCSFCLEEGHHIHRCKDTSISLLNEEIEEIAAMDWRLDLGSGFIRNKLTSLTLPELKVLGYKHTLPNMSKINEDALIKELSDIFLENTNTHRYIIENMNHSELDYFAEKVHQYTASRNSDDAMPVDDIREILYGDDDNDNDNDNDANKNDEFALIPMNVSLDTDFMQPIIYSLNLGMNVIYFSYYGLLWASFIYLWYFIATQKH
jgi:hypothetical protein